MRLVSSNSNQVQVVVTWIVCIIVFMVTCVAQDQPENSTDTPAKQDPPSLEERFSQTDQDQSGELSLEEVLASVAEENHPKRKQRFLVCDFNGDTALSKNEFAAYLDRTDAVVPDPIQDLFEQQRPLFNKWFESADQDSSGDLSVDERKAANRDTWMSGFLYHMDLDEDDLISLAEMEQGLVWAYGVSTTNGVDLRTNDGSIFNYRTYICDADHDRNGVLSQEEAQKRFANFKTKTDEEITALIGKLDVDQNAVLTIEELAGEFPVPLILVFQQYDSSLDGRVSPEELAQNASKWMQPYVPRAFPAYDLNADGSLSFHEFRLSPFGNSGLRWTDLPVDRNADGVIDLREFHPENRLGFLGISHSFLNALDLNHDGVLDLNEYDYKVDAFRVAPVHAITLLDLDDNQLLSISELYRVAEQELRSDASQQRFQESDDDSNGVLSHEEFVANASQLQFAMKLEHALQNLKPQFDQRDQDQSQTLSRDEVLADIKEEFLPRRGQLFAIADEDASGDLNLQEFLIVAETSNAILSDPTVKILDEELKTLKTWFQQADTDSSGDLTIDERKAANSLTWMAGNLFHADFNQDELLTWKELESALAWAYGVRLPDETPLRFPNARIFNYRTYVCDTDHDRDGIVSQQEFEKRFSHKSPAEQVDLFQRLDTDKSGTIEIPEMIDEFSFSLIQEFQHYDSDFDGEISPEELDENANKWKQPYVPSMFPAYDRNANGAISFEEFQLSPLGSSGLRWTDTPRDRNNDAMLDLSEFHPENTLGFLGLSRLYFRTLDRNDDSYLTLDEFDYKVDAFRVPVDQAFAVIDADDNGRLAIDEVFPHSRDGFAFEEHQPLFKKADANDDQSLSQDEFQAHADALRVAMAKEHFFLQELKWRTRHIDSNSDERITQDEVRATGDKKYAEKRAQRFLMSDFDESGDLNRHEFAAYLNHEFAVVPDPVVEIFEQEKPGIVEWFETLDTDGNDAVSTAERDQSERTHWLSDFIFDADLNQDESLSREELLSGAAWAFGIQTLDGVVLRPSHGQIFNYRTYMCDPDQNNDGMLSIQEARNRFSHNKGLSEQDVDELIQKLNIDGNQQLTITELMSDFMTSPLNDFQRYDSSFDGKISAEELVANTNRWLKPYVPRAFPAYDLDRDQSLSLHEFRLSPFANSGLRWTNRPVDRNGDAKLDLQEFHPDKSLRFLGVSRIFFTALDLNNDGFLDLDEYDFKVDASVIPAEEFVARTDADGDGIVSAAELHQRFSLSPSEYFDRWYHVISHVMSGDQPWTVRLTQHFVEHNRRIENHQIGKKFQNLDADRNSLLSASELSSFSLPENAKESRQQRMSIADTDGDGHLTAIEFAAFAHPAVFVPDPLSDRALRICERIAAAPSLDEQEIRKALESNGVKLNATIYGEDKSQLIKSVLTGFGIIDSEANFIRQPDGRMLNLWTFRGRDKDHDGKLARAEFLQDSSEQGEQTFAEVDADGDGYMEPSELIRNGKAWLFWSNSVSSFLQFDQDQNGSITAQELKDHAKSYQKRICEPAIAAFDVNGDGELNFQEFRLSLIPNPYDQFSQRPKDINEDGRLSIEELSTNYPGVPKLYAALVFQHLDLNDDQFLGTEEFDYKFRFQDLPAEDAFALIDRDASGEIALNETMQYAQIAHGIDKNNSGANVRLMRIEDAFYADDADTNGTLSRVEFQEAIHLTAALERGGNKERQEKKRFESPQPAAERPAETKWKFWALVSFNVLLVGGVGFWALKK